MSARRFIGHGRARGARRTRQEFAERLLFIKFPATRHWGGRQRAGALFGLVGGAVCPLAGSMLTALSWLTGTGGAGWYLHRVGTLLLLATIPLLIFGAHCLDLLEKGARRQG